MNWSGCWLALWAFAAFAGEPSQWEVKCPRKGDSISVVAKEKSVVFVVTSKMGIGRGEIVLKQGSWPEDVRLQLHLKGLEGFKVDNGEVRLGAAAGVQASGTNLAYRVERIMPGNREQSLTKEDPFWMQIRAYDRSGRPVTHFPAADSTIEVRLPKAFLGKGVKTINLEWIDFYR